MAMNHQPAPGDVARSHERRSTAGTRRVTRSRSIGPGGIAVLGVVLGVVVSSPAAAQDVEGWRFSIEPYLFAPVQATGEAGVGEATVDVDASISDMLDDLDDAFMIRAEGWYERLGLIVETTWLDTGLAGPEDRFTLDTGLFVADILASARVLSWFADDDPDSFGAGLDLQLGGRLILLDLALTLAERRRELSDAYGRVTLGVIVPLRFTEIVDAELTFRVGLPGPEYQAQALVGLHVSIVAFRLGYRVTRFGIEGEAGTLEVLLHGPYLGIAVLLEQHRLE